MKKKKKNLPKDFDELILEGNIPALKAVFETCELDAYSGRAMNMQTALHWCGIPDELVTWLLSKGLDINVRDSYGNTPLYTHAVYGSSTVDLLIKLGADVNAPANDKSTPLHAAALNFRLETLRELITHGAEVNAKTEEQNLTPLAYALFSCQSHHIPVAVNVIKFLLLAGATTNSVMSQRVIDIGNEFEENRANFDDASLIEAKLQELYQLFHVTPSVHR